MPSPRPSGATPPPFWNRVPGLASMHCSPAPMPRRPPSSPGTRITRRLSAGSRLELCRAAAVAVAPDLLAPPRLQEQPGLRRRRGRPGTRRPLGSHHLRPASQSYGRGLGGGDGAPHGSAARRAGARRLSSRADPGIGRRPVDLPPVLRYRERGRRCACQDAPGTSARTTSLRCAKATACAWPPSSRPAPATDGQSAVRPQVLGVLPITSDSSPPGLRSVRWRIAEERATPFSVALCT